MTLYSARAGSKYISMSLNVKRKRRTYCDTLKCIHIPVNGDKTFIIILYYISAVLKVHRTKFYAHMMCGSQNRSVSHFEFGIWFFFYVKKMLLL